MVTSGLCFSRRHIRPMARLGFSENPHKKVALKIVRSAPKTAWTPVFSSMFHVKHSLRCAALVYVYSARTTLSEIMCKARGLHLEKTNGSLSNL